MAFDAGCDPLFLKREKRGIVVAVGGDVDEHAARGRSERWICGDGYHVH